MSNKTIDAFFALVRAGLWSNANVDLNLDFDGVDWEKVYQFAEEQSLVGLVAAGMENLVDNINVPLELKLQIIGEALQLEQQNRAMNAFIANLIAEMREAGIYTLLVKGQGVAQCYEKPFWRSCGDVDLMLSDDNYQNAKEYLLPKATYVENEEKHKKHLAMAINDWTVELHGSLRCGFSARIDKSLDELYNDTFYGGNVSSWDNQGTQVFLLGKENNVLYVFVHLLNHFYKGGVGLRQICDWCRLLWTYRDSLKHELLELRIRKMGLMSEWKAFCSLATKYLGMPEILEFMFQNSRKAKWEKKADKIMDFILMSGNMGHNRMSNEVGNKSFFTRKFLSFGQRVGDLLNHARIFPLDSIRFFPSIVLNGIRQQ